ncbi:MAG: transcriptional repressor LexA [Microgenomates group bacterium]
MLPTKQKEVLGFISKYQKEHGHGPTLDEIATQLKRSIPTIHQHVSTLRTKGFLKTPTSTARSIGTFDSSDEIQEIPLIGYISAGEGIENIETPEPLKVQKSLLSPSGQHYALIVRGTSMIDDGIMPNDIVLVKHQNYGDNGDVVIVLIGSKEGDLATIKRFYNHGRQIELRPKNPALQSKWYDSGDIEIRGKFVGLLRKGN